MDEASLCDRVALIQKGQIMTTDSPAQLTRNFSNRIYEVRAADRLATMQKLKNMPEVEDVYPFGEADHLVLKKGVTSFTMPEHINHKEIHPDIEDLFIHLMKQHNG
jgi:ABC-type multidrug transport system ATPase subunit